MPRRHTAFTLLELLIVTSLIGVGLLVGVGVMSRAQQSARQVQCVNQLRQIHQALMTRAADLNGTFPSAGNYPSYASWARNWDYDLIAQKYLPGWDVFRCPAAPKEWSNAGFYIHYGLNSYIPPAEGATPVDRAFGRLSRVEEPSRTVLLADSVYPNATSANSGFYLIADAARIHGRHGGRANVIFVDGHVESLKPGEAANPESPLYRLYRQ